MPRLPLRVASLIVFTISALLFFSGYTLQRRALIAMQTALEPLNTDYNNYHSNKHPKLQQSPLLPSSISPAAKTAYVQLANTLTDLCHALTVFKTLKEKGSKKDMLVLYPKAWEAKVLRVPIKDPESNDGLPAEPEAPETQIQGEPNWAEVRRLLQLAAGMNIKARGVVDILPGKLDITESQRINPLHLLTLNTYTRLLLLSPTILINLHLDSLLDASTLLTFSFASPSHPLSSTFLLVTPSHTSLSHLESHLESHPLPLPPIPLLASAFPDTLLTLPRFPYLYTTSDLMNNSLLDYENRMGKSAVVAFGEGERPWVVETKGGGRECGEGVEDCEGRRKVWEGLKERFEEGRRGVCGWDWEFRG